MINEEEIKQKINEEFENYKKNIKKPNILLVGGTGVGKSSLVNKIFGMELAKIGIGKPVTNSINKFQNDDIGIALFDSPGYEIGAEKTKKFEDEVINIKDNIHLIWYCIDVSSDRITDFDIGSINKFKNNNLSVSIVLTKSELRTESKVNELKNDIKSSISNINIYETSTVSNDQIFAIELNRLITDSINKLPETLKDGFISAQKISLKEKWNRSHTAILQHVTGAFAIGFTPIPLSDAPLLIANQMGMIARILYIYDLKGLQNMLTIGGGGGIIGQIMATLGKSVVGQILKFIPGIGTLIGGAINGTIASALTSALGEAVNISCYKLYESILNGNTNIEAQIATFGDTVFNCTKTYIEAKKDKNDYRLPE